jgi:hypothetical protein
VRSRTRMSSVMVHRAARGSGWCAHAVRPRGARSGQEPPEAGRRGSELGKGPSIPSAVGPLVPRPGGETLPERKKVTWAGWGTVPRASRATLSRPAPSPLRSKSLGCKRRASPIGRSHFFFFGAVPRAKKVAWRGRGTVPGANEVTFFFSAPSPGRKKSLGAVGGRPPREKSRLARSGDVPLVHKVTSFSRRTVPKLARATLSRDPPVSMPRFQQRRNFHPPWRTNGAVVKRWRCPFLPSLKTCPSFL